MPGRTFLSAASTALLQAGPNAAPPTAGQGSGGFADLDVRKYRLQVIGSWAAVLGFAGTTFTIGTSALYWPVVGQVLARYAPAVVVGLIVAESSSRTYSRSRNAPEPRTSRHAIRPLRASHANAHGGAAACAAAHATATMRTHPGAGAWSGGGRLEWFR